MEEKKLTDEEIVKAYFVDCKKRSCETCPLGDIENCQVYIKDLIHRLQSENETQRKIIEYQDGLPDLVEQQKAEIERLTEERFNLNAEIAKQKIEYEALKCGTEIVCGAREIVSEVIKTEIKQQAVKDTAKEILEMADTINKGGQNDLCELEVAIKERYGVIYEEND